MTPASFSTLRDGPPGRDPQAGVEGGERLVEQHEFRLAGQGPGQRDALLLAAGELVRAPFGHGRVERDHLEQFGDPGLHGPAPARAALTASRPKAMFWPTVRCGKRAPSWAT